MSETEHEGIYEPDDLEVNRNSKISIIQHISYRLGESKCLEHEENGSMNRAQMLSMALASLSYKFGLDPNSNRTAIANQLKALYADSLERRSIRLSFINKKTFYKSGSDIKPGMSKTDYARTVAATLVFPWEGDAHVGEKNKVVSKFFFESALDSLNAPDESGPTPLKQKRFEELERKTKLEEAASLAERIELDDQEDWSGSKYDEIKIIVPDYQRHSDQWTKPKHIAFVDSILRDIPMPSIVLGRKDKREPWQLIDGQQRLKTYLRFLNARYTYNGKTHVEWPKWVKDRFADYKFNVEYITADSDAELALIFERYNSSGKALNAAELRCARFHHTSALHHYIMAISGGPKMDGAVPSQLRIGVSEDLEKHAARAYEIRYKIPGISKPEPDERKQVRRSTIKSYDILCKIVSYSVYRQTDVLLRGSKNETPSGAQACKAVLAAYNHGSTASEVVDRLYLIVAKVSSIFGDSNDWGFAWRTLKYFGADEDAGTEAEWRPFGGVNAWVAQMQCASLWNLSPRQLDLLELNTDTVRTKWHEFATDEKHGFLGVRQNSKTIWRKQERWCGIVIELLEELGESHVYLRAHIGPNTSDAVAALLHTLEHLLAEGDEEMDELRASIVDMLKEMDPDIHELVFKDLENRD